MPAKRTFTGFGFGAIQAGLFVYEAWRSGNFGRLVVAEVVPQVVEAIRSNGGYYTLNIAEPTGVRSVRVGPLDLYNPLVEADRAALIQAVCDSHEIATALPSVSFYGAGRPGDVLDILAAGLKAKRSRNEAPAAVLYTAENHNHAAEILDRLLSESAGIPPREARTQLLNTVIGKMSGVVGDEAQIREQGVAPMALGLMRAFLVEAFNRILITQITLPGFQRGIEVFEEKADLLPFEEAKLYGHNATHALLGYLLKEKGAALMSEASSDPALLAFARGAFLQESGLALGRKYKGQDPLFTEAGFQAYVDDLLVRMTNPYLRDAVDRVTRDTRRKLGWDDRLIGTIRLALGQGVEPARFAHAAVVALRQLAAEEKTPQEHLPDSLWPRDSSQQVKECLARNA